MMFRILAKPVSMLTFPNSTNHKLHKRLREYHHQFGNNMVIKHGTGHIKNGHGDSTTC